MRKKYRSQSKLGKRPNWSQSIQPGFFSNQIAGGGGGFISKLEFVTKIFLF